MKKKILLSNLIWSLPLLPLSTLSCNNQTSNNNSKDFEIVNNELISFNKNKNYAGEITLPEGITKIKNEVFNGFDKITKIHLPQSLQTIGKETFSHCNSIEEINIPDTVNLNTEGAFEMCFNLKTVHIPNNTTIIKTNAFKQCESLETLDLTNTNVNQIQVNTFKGCTNLKEVKVKKDTQIDPQASNNNSIFTYYIFL